MKVIPISKELIQRGCAKLYFTPEIIKLLTGYLRLANSTLVSPTAPFNACLLRSADPLLIFVWPDKYRESCELASKYLFNLMRETLPHVLDEQGKYVVNLHGVICDFSGLLHLFADNSKNGDLAIPFVYAENPIT